MSRKKNQRVRRKNFFANSYIFVILGFFAIAGLLYSFRGQSVTGDVVKQNNQYTQYDGTTTLYDNPDSDVVFSYPSQLHLEAIPAETTPNAVLLTQFISNESYYQLGDDRDGNYQENFMLIDFKIFQRPEVTNVKDFLVTQLGLETSSLQKQSVPLQGTMVGARRNNKYVAFIYNGKIYLFILTGGSGNGTTYSEKVEDLFDSVIQSIKPR